MVLDLLRKRDLWYVTGCYNGRTHHVRGPCARNIGGNGGLWVYRMAILGNQRGRRRLLQLRSLLTSIFFKQ
jgi:hypothetical protein